MNVTQRTLYVQGALLSLLLTAAVSADLRADWQSAEGLLDLWPGGRPDRSGFWKDLRVAVDGWLNMGVTYNTDQPTDRYNGPVSFADRAGEPQLNQLYLHLQRRVDAGGSAWDWGGRLDLLFGTDAAFTEARGDPDANWDSDLTGDRFYHLAIPQAYAEWFAPIGHGLKIRLGHFYTIVGSEAIAAPENFFYTRSYATQHGEPFTHTGLLFNYRLNDQFDLSAGVITGSPTAGWDGAFDRSHNNTAFIGGFTWASEEGDTSVAINAIHGSIRDPAAGDQNLLSTVLQHDLSTTLHWKIQHDYAWVSTADAKHNAEWYAIVNYLTFDFRERLTLGLRFEWFRDDDGTRVIAPVREGKLVGLPANYFALTGGYTWKPMPWFSFRPNLRYDWCDNGRPFSSHASNTQLLLSLDLLFIF